MDRRESHDWVKGRLAAWRAGLLDEADDARIEAHLAACADCRATAEAFAVAPGEAPGAHVSPAILARWPQARTELRGLERALVRRHLERCAECRQDLESLGHAAVLEFRPGWESGHELDAAPAKPAIAAAPNVRIVRFDPGFFSHRERWLAAWGAVASAAAVVLLVFGIRGGFEGQPLSTPVGLRPAEGVIASEPLTGLSLRIAPRPRSLSGPVRNADAGEGRLNVIPIAGALQSLALGIKPLDVPDTSLVRVSLLDMRGRTLFTVQYRQWEFAPRRMLLIDRKGAPLTPGQYVVELASQIEKHGEPLARTSRYRFELREQATGP